MHIVYQTTNLINDKIYVGVQNHEKNNYLGSGIGIKRAIKKYGENNFKKEILFDCESTEETYWLESIIVNKWYVSQIWNYNMIVGGENPKGMFSKSHSIESKLKMSSKLKGRKLTEEHKRKVSESLRGKNHPYYGKHRSEKTKEKLSKANIGKKHSEKSKKKMSIAKKGCVTWNKGMKMSKDFCEKAAKSNFKSIKCISLESNLVLGVFESMKDAAEFIGIRRPMLTYYMKKHNGIVGTLKHKDIEILLRWEH